MNVWDQYRHEKRHLRPLLTTARSLELMRAWVVDTGLVPQVEGGDDPEGNDPWGILTPSRNRKEEEAAPIACLSPSRGTTRPGRRTVEVLNTPVKETFTLEVANNSVKEMVDEEVSAIPLSPIKMVSLKNSR